MTVPAAVLHVSAPETARALDRLLGTALTADLAPD